MIQSSYSPGNANNSNSGKTNNSIPTAYKNGNFPNGFSGVKNGYLSSSLPSSVSSSAKTSGSTTPTALHVASPTLNSPRNVTPTKMATTPVNSITIKTNVPISSSQAPSSTGGATPLYQCEQCGKVYKHRNCLNKHLWEHHESWEVTKKFCSTKHQQVQLLEAAQVLVEMNVVRRGF